MKRKITAFTRKNNPPNLTLLKQLQQKKPKVLNVIPETSKVTEIGTKYEPVINIITRTSNRPIGFNICRTSIVNQTYSNIRHIVGYDDLKDHKYVTESGAEVIFIDKSKIEKKPDIPNPNTGRRFIYNLYINELVKEVNEGYVLVLDDDDRLINPKAVQKMINMLDETTDMLIWQMRYPDKRILPPLTGMGRNPQIGQIGSPCVLVKASIAKSIKWDGWKCGDYRYISKCFNLSKNVKWINEPLIELGNSGGLGQRVDLKKKPNLKGLETLLRKISIQK